MALDDQVRALATRAGQEIKRVRRTSLVVIPADGPTTCPARATYLAANHPGYTGQVWWNLSMYPDHPGPTDPALGDMRIRWVTEEV